jgi:hypothetical protein
VRWAAAGLCWLTACSLATWLAVDLAPAWRLAAVAVIWLSGMPPLWRGVLLRGARATRALEWRPGEPAPAFFIWVGRPARRLPACPRGCQRFGGGPWMLNFVTPEGNQWWLVDPPLQDAAALRRLSRSLEWRGERGAGGPAGRN